MGKRALRWRGGGADWERRTEGNREREIKGKVNRGRGEQKEEKERGIQGEVNRGRGEQRGTEMEGNRGERGTKGKGE
jgi:hypothetical protein